MPHDQGPILFVIPDEQLRQELAAALDERESPYPYRMIATSRAARDLLTHEAVGCVVMTKDAALGGEDGQSGLVATHLSLPPTVTLLQAGDGYPDHLYNPEALHTWCTMPFSLEELFEEIARVLRRAQSP